MVFATAGIRCIVEAVPQLRSSVPTNTTTPFTPGAPAPVRGWWRNPRIWLAGRNGTRPTRSPSTTRLFRTGKSSSLSRMSSGTPTWYTPTGLAARNLLPCPSSLSPCQFSQKPQRTIHGLGIRIELSKIRLQDNHIGAPSANRSAYLPQVPVRSRMGENQTRSFGAPAAPNARKHPQSMDADTLTSPRGHGCSPVCRRLRG